MSFSLLSDKPRPVCVADCRRVLLCPGRTPAGGRVGTVQENEELGPEGLGVSRRVSTEPSGWRKEAGRKEQSCRGPGMRRWRH